MLEEVIPIMKRKTTGKSSLIFQQDKCGLHMRLNEKKTEPLVFELLKGHNLNVIDNVWNAQRKD